jgi:hypothetical protein
MWTLLSAFIDTSRKGLQQLRTRIQQSQLRLFRGVIAQLAEVPGATVHSGAV